MSAYEKKPGAGTLTGGPQQSPGGSDGAMGPGKRTLVEQSYGAPVAAAAPNQGSMQGGGGVATHQADVTVPLSASIAVSTEDHDDAHEGQPGASGAGPATAAGAGQGPATNQGPQATAAPAGPLVFSELPGGPDLVVEEHDAVASNLAYTGDVARGGATPSGFGVTRNTLGRFANVTISPPRSGSIQVSASLTYTIRWQTRTGTGPGGQVDIPTATAPVLTQANYPQAVTDLTPNASDLGGRPPRSQFWAQDLTERHEQFHADERRTFGGQSVQHAQSWLNTQSAANQAAVPNLLDQAWNNQVRAFLARVMANPGKEQRAYADGAAAYTARADAIRQRGTANQYPGGPGGGGGGGGAGAGGTSGTTGSGGSMGAGGTGGSGGTTGSGGSTGAGGAGGSGGTTGSGGSTGAGGTGGAGGSHGSSSGPNPHP